MLRTARVAEGKKFTIEAGFRQVCLEPGKVLYLFAPRQFLQRCLQKVAQQPAFINEVVASVEVAVEFQDEGVCTTFAIAAHRSLAVDEGMQDTVDESFRNSSDVPIRPDFEYVQKESPELLGFAGELCRAPCRVAFENRDELQILDTPISKISIDVPSVRSVCTVESHQHVELNSVFPKQFKPSPCAMIRSIPRRVFSEIIVPLRRTVQADTHQKFIGCEKFTPLIVQQRTVGLHCIFDELSTLAILVLKFYCPLEKLFSCQQRLASLPAEGALVRLTGEVLAGKTHQGFISHHRPDDVGVQLLGLFKIVTILTLEIALT